MRLIETPIRVRSLTVSARGRKAATAGLAIPHSVAAARHQRAKAEIDAAIDIYRETGSIKQAAMALHITCGKANYIIEKCGVARFRRARHTTPSIEEIILHRVAYPWWGEESQAARWFGVHRSSLKWKSKKTERAHHEKLER